MYLQIVQIGLVEIRNTLPQPADSNGILIVKLKKITLQYRGHVYFESVRPDFTF